MPDKVFMPVTNEVLAQVRAMIEGATHAALASSEPGTGQPLVSRVAMATHADGAPLLLTSALAAHTQALKEEPRCALLIGAVSKGDPMAQPRLSAICLAHRVCEGERSRARQRFLKHHPKSQNYIDLPDFGFWRLEIERVSYNAGFGRAYAISSEQLGGRSDDTDRSAS